MTVPAGWDALLAAPRPGQHIAQLFTDPDFLVRAVGRFAAEGLRRSEGVIVIATPVHWRCIERQLRQEGLAIDELERRRRLAVVDAGGASKVRSWTGSRIGRDSRRGSAGSSTG
jgi:hypothetical protein